MKVAMVTPYPPRADGIGEHTRTLVHELGARDDIDVQVLTSRRPSADHLTPDVHRILSVDPRSVRSSIDMLRDTRPDVIHYQFAIPALGLAGLAGLLVGARMRRTSGTPIVVTLHEVRRELDLLGGVGRVLYRRLVQLADRIVVHTDDARELLVSVCGADPANVVTTPLGARPPSADRVVPAVIDDVRSRYGLTDRPVALCFGYLHPDKGIEYLVEAMARLRRRAGASSADIDVLIAGEVRARSGLFRMFERSDRTYEATLRRAVKHAGLSSHVRFLGFVPSADVPALFTLARAVVMPCTKVTQSSVMASAIATGTPVIASDLPGLREALGDGGVLVAPGDPDALADALDAVMFDDHLAATLSDQQQRRGPMIGLASVAATLSGVYRELVAASSTVDPIRSNMGINGG